MIDGLLVIDKPSGMTSHDVVGRCRRVVGQRRVGHAGTLDPGATGVLLVALGRATRLMRYVSELPKSYAGEIVLGRSTTTLDNEGETVAMFDMSSITGADVRVAATKFVGDIEQIPPMVSAVQIGGRRLHELARAGIEVERKPRPVSIYRIDIHATDDPSVFRAEVDCSSGTYIRTLAADIGETLGGGAHLRNLRRVAIGDFDTSAAASLDELETVWQERLQSPFAMVKHLDHVEVSTDIARVISHGKSLQREELAAPGDGPLALVNANGELLAVYEGKATVRPSVVLMAN